MKPYRLIISVLLTLLSMIGADAAITITGVTTRNYYSGSVTFTVPNEAGFTIVSQVDGITIQENTAYTESRPGYHELFVTKTPAAGGTAETALVQFIINARTPADTGLANWVPLEAVDAPADALAVTQVAFHTPARVPAGMAFPLVVRLTEAGGGIAKLNATAFASSAGGRAATWRVFRGAGAGVWSAPTTAGPLVLTLRIGDRTFTQTVQIEGAPAWQTLSGAVSGTRTFGPNGFVTVSGDVNVPAGATLRFEAGTIVRVNPGATIDVQGALVIAGTTAEPVLFTRFNPLLPWGGFWIHGSTATGNITAAFLTGAGADQGWIGSHGYNAHKPQQPVVACEDSTVNLTDTWIVDNPDGQGAHGDGAAVTFTRCLVQRTRTCGQFNNGRARLLDSHIVEIPKADYIFADDDNDGFYMTGAPSTPGVGHELTNSVIGWTKDDGADAGSGAAGIVTTTNCWFDSCFHEGMAWSETRTANVTNTVSINNGQGIEAGFGSPAVTATNLLVVGNLVGARFGDNYDWDYNGTLNVQNSLLLNNGRDVWGFEWNSWTYRTDRMTIQNNLLTAPLARHPNNGVFNPASHAAQIGAFLTAPDTRRGFALVGRARQNTRASYGGELTVHLDRPATNDITLPWQIIGKTSLESDTEVVLTSGTVQFSAGMNAARLTLPALPGAANFSWLAVTFDDATNAVATGMRACHFVDLPQPPNTAVTLVPFGAVWKYLDNGTNQGTAWRAQGFNDTSWRSGPAELGYGDNPRDETTIVEDNPTPGYNANDTNRYATTYFRSIFTVADVSALSTLDLNVRYDDGVVVYLNGQRVAATTNVPVDPAFTFFTGGSTFENSMLNATPLTTALNNGVNTIAAEIHQHDAGSSDISFDLRLIGNPAPTAAQIRSRAGTLGRALHLFWTTPGVIPQQSVDLVNWQDRPDLTSPLTIVPSGPQAFFRLVLP